MWQMKKYENSSQHFLCSSWRILLPSYINFWSVVFEILCRQTQRQTDAQKTPKTINARRMRTANEMKSYKKYAKQGSLAKAASNPCNKLWLLSTTMFLGSPRVSTPNRTSIHSDVFAHSAHRSCDRLTDRHTESSITIVCFSCIRRSLKTGKGGNYDALLLDAAWHMTPKPTGHWRLISTSNFSFDNRIFWGLSFTVPKVSKIWQSQSNLI